MQQKLQEVPISLRANLKKTVDATIVQPVKDARDGVTNAATGAATGGIEAAKNAVANALTRLRAADPEVRQPHLFSFGLNSRNHTTCIKL